MFHFLQKFSQASSKILTSPFTVKLKTSKRINTLTLKTCRQRNFYPLFPRPWLFSSYPVCMNPARYYHTSPSSFKKKQKEVLLPPKSPSTITYLPDSPKPALYVTLAGLIPFVAPPLVMVMTKSYIPLLAFVQMAYGASFLSFLGGIRWGFALPQGSPAKPDYLNLANSIAPVIFSWFAFLASEKISEAIVTVLIGLGITLHVELFLLPHYPNWFKALRIVVTLVAFFSYIVTLVVKNYYPENGPKRTSQVE
ncbi:transmembrane protein 69 [Erinaceus europaeus]|uniref:Transmembrane protein 69 n=1 Tax=Erinaceus europaeus TaxID=9365 RepID=A0A1S3APJ1_ERIEU|nr:transmembrane protein 69 [Erinaceus europaeus]XP_060061979.1 transmembrane protein 69 [Erinaceus europaeus]XP_060061980.1 transmembrane protein 69 [Erinaceus europaeus]XP_060061981.1 transmembrane protein 69 [Erinaceus europaeus]XP_060061982.1 transmembrane protein 69 [Erinaceus europaeus]XP_060061983.1 transmembrane protein 69 [Erinaceus europaeus]XP_060061984.1 transmembrane protein 69 [Erinaceus europaeus]